eukprot:1285210-Pleurochrysis_carterae.AAC.1
MFIPLDSARRERSTVLLLDCVEHPFAMLFEVGACTDREAAFSASEPSLLETRAEAFSFAWSLLGLMA